MAPAKPKNTSRNTTTSKRAQAADDDPGDPPGSGIGSPMVAVTRPTSDTEEPQGHVVPDSEPERQALESPLVGNQSTRSVGIIMDRGRREDDDDIPESPTDVHQPPRSQPHVSEDLPSLFFDSWKEESTYYGPFNKLREELARLKKALDTGVFTHDQYRRYVHDVMSQGEQWYNNHHLVREVRREEKRPERASPATRRQSVHLKPVTIPPNSSEEQEIEDEIFLSVLRQSRNDTKGATVGNTSKARAAEPDRSVANVNRATRPNNMNDATTEREGSFTSESNNDATHPVQPVVPWAIPDYPYRAGQSDTPVEAQYRYLRTTVLRLKGAAENITDMHSDELQYEKAMADSMQELDQDGYAKYDKKRNDLRNRLTKMYSTILDHVGEIRVSCRELLVACWANGNTNGMAPASIFAYVLRLARIVDAFGRSIAVLDRERYNHQMRQRNLPEKQLHHAGRPDRALGDQLRSMVLAEEVPGIVDARGSPHRYQAYDPFFFPKLNEVS
jgi:hypothetical protein